MQGWLSQTRHKLAALNYYSKPLAPARFEALVRSGERIEPR
ncbi:hypothetical protein [Massilia glaciei]|nr:hypothetical protein [Massilia glaciei]